MITARTRSLTRASWRSWTRWTSNDALACLVGLFVMLQAYVPFFQQMVIDLPAAAPAAH